MFKCRGFRASLDFITGRNRSHDFPTPPSASIGGEYRANRDGFEGTHQTYSSSKKIDPSLVKIPNSTQTNQGVRSKSTSNLSDIKIKEETSRSSYDISRIPRPSKRLAKEQKKLEKQLLEEQKRQEKIAAKERDRQEKLAKERVKQMNSVQQIRPPPRSKCKKKTSAPRPPDRQIKNQTPAITHQVQEKQMQEPRKTPRRPKTYSTNTLESSISKTSGPPPYGEYPDIIIDGDSNGNISFGKPLDYNSSWDLISEHRQQMNQPAATAPVAPKRKKDLQYKVGNLQITTNNNSEA